MNNKKEGMDKKDKSKKEITNSEPDFKAAEKKIESVLVKFFTEDTMLLNAFCTVDKIPDAKQKTLGISTTSQPPCIKYNPNFINTISEERLEMVMVQEGFKILLKHPTTRLAKPKHISALSSSITVTPLSLGGLMNTKELEEFFPTAEKFGLQENQYFEEYFRRLMDNVEDTNQKIKEIWNSMSKEEKQKLIDDAKQSGQGQGEPQEGEGQGDGKGEGFAEYKDEKDAMKDYSDPNSTNSDEWGENDLFDADIQQMVDENKHSSRDWGKYTGDAMGAIVAANTPKISWKEIVRRFTRSVMSRRTVSSRMKMNRRYGLRWPGARREYDTKIIFALDVSGSMTNEDIAEGLAVINSVCKHAELIYIMFDTEIKRVEKDFKRAKQEFKIYGRGGTDFQCIVDYANENNVDGVVIYTDGYAAEPSKLKRKAKMLWLLNGKDNNPPCDWGFAAHLDRYENEH